MENEQQEKPENQQFPGTKELIGEKEIEDALSTMLKYKSAKENYTQKVVNAEEWWKSKHWDRFTSESSNPNDPKPVSAWLFNSIINKHADFQDNIPSPAIMPREKSDEETAKLLSQVVPEILEQNGFENTYSDCSWDKPKTGTGIYGVFWNQEKENGLGDIEIKKVDVINLFWEPGIEDIQKSQNVFSVDLVNRDTLVSEYPALKEKIGKQDIVYKPEYVYESDIDTTGKVQVVDWYYKKKVRSEIEGVDTVRNVLHYCKFIPGIVLYATENDPEMAQSGWYEHGLYPFVFDVLFPEKGMPVGFGYIDIMVNPQEYIDKLDQVILKNASLQRPRYFMKSSVGVNINDFLDLSKDIVEVNGDVDEKAVRPIETPKMSDIVMTTREAKIEEIKETSGNRDFSQGSTTSGVTAASAIAALQEAGSKLSRDMIKGTYTAHTQVVTMVIELIRQFYDLPRCYRITQPNGSTEYVTLTNDGLKPREIMTGNDNPAFRKPIFDIKVSAQKASPYSRIANNELAKELYGMGVFSPENVDQALAVVSMMDFDRKDEVLRKISENGTMYQKMQQLTQAMQQMASLIAETTGDNRLPAILSTILNENQGSGEVRNVLPGASKEVNSLGAAKEEGSKTDKARKQTVQATQVVDK